MTLPCRSTTLSRFHRHACTQCESSNVAAWHGSPASSPNTGTVQVDFAAGRDPKKYCVPLAEVIFQYSPLSSPLPSVVSRSIREPLSLLDRQSPFASLRISGPPPPL